MTYDLEHLGKTIKKERLRLNLSQKELGECLKVSNKQISVYEKSKAIPYFDTLCRMCEVFNCELGYLLGEKDYKSGTKLDTAISESLKLSPKAINTIRYITGEDSSCLFLGLESNEFSETLNALITTPTFITFIENLKNYKNSVSYYNSLFSDLISEIGEEDFQIAWKIFNSSIDYEHDPKIKTKDNIKNALVRIDEIINEQQYYDNSIKAVKYDLIKSFELLLNDFIT